MGDGWHREPAQTGRMLALPDSTESHWQVKGRRKLLLLAIPRRTVQRILGPDSDADVEDTFRPLSIQSWDAPLVEAEAHLHEDLDVATLADLAGLSVRHFSRAFTKQLGQTPIGGSCRCASSGWVFYRVATLTAWSKSVIPTCHCHRRNCMTGSRTLMPRKLRIFIDFLQERWGRAAQA
ncbi:AraC family transcriptional regulator [Acidovorax sp. NCPPB 2350]|nr:AraC family transcriptional regulator [Acidovorax sp. NCPPB 2350]